MKKEIAFFDFDGTITKKDTLFEFIKFTKGTFRFYLGFLLNLHFLIAYKLNLISNQSAKEKILQFFFSNTPVKDFKQCCKKFSKEILPGLIRPKALFEIRQLQERNVIVAIVSASPENWIEDWAFQYHLQLIGSRLEVTNEKITGKIHGKNCSGDEKVSRIKEVYDLSEYKVVAAYGDTKGDKSMLALARSSYYKPFI